MSQWHLIDCGLIVAFGHHHAETALLAEELAHRSCRLDIYAFRGAEVSIPFARVIPHFRHYFYTSVSTDQISGELEEFMLLSSVYLEDLTKIDRARFHADDVVIFPTLGHNELPAILQWADSFHETAPFRTIIVQHFPVEARRRRRVSFPESYYRWAWRKIPSRLADRLVFCTTTPILAAQYESVLGTRPHVIPWIKQSPSLRSQDGPHGVEARTSRRRRINAAYIGHGRPERGYQLLPSIVECCAGIPGLRFSIQACWHDRKLATIDAALEKNANVELTKGALDADRYLAFIADADLILALNDPDQGYRHMLSGVYADAALAGKPVIAHRETWAGGEVRINGNGVVFEPYTPEAVSTAIAMAAADIDRLSARATEHAAELRPRHGPSAAVEFFQRCPTVGAGRGRGDRPAPT